jgi:hypothetical protein
MKTKIPILMLIVLAGFLLVMLAGCGGSGGGVRATAEALGTTFPTIAKATPDAPVYVEPTAVPAVQSPLSEISGREEIEVTRIVEVVVTATPDIQGFPAPDAAGFLNAPVYVDEDVQPCPVKYWKRGRCVANDTQIEAYAAGGN